MTEINTVGVMLVVIAVILFFLLGTAIIILIDSKARLPGGFTSNPFSIIGMRRDHPIIAFLTTFILFIIIASLILEVIVALFGGLMKETDDSEVPVKEISPSQLGKKQRIKRFHNYPEVIKASLGEKNLCYLCHGDYPHEKKPMIRSILNMHSQFVACLTCHTIKKYKGNKNYSVEWLNYSGINVKQKPYGTSYDKQSGRLNITDDYYSKIVVYKKINEEKILLEAIPGDKKYIEIEKGILASNNNANELRRIKKNAHFVVNKKGQKCSSCHTSEKDGLVPFAELGFSETRTQDLTHLNIVGLVEKYDSFFIPNLLGSSKSSLSGGKISKEQQKEEREMTRDPRKWWKKQYGK